MPTAVSGVLTISSRERSWSWLGALRASSRWPKRSGASATMRRTTPDLRRPTAVLGVLPPRTLLLDVAGPIEVLRKANLEQAEVRFEVRYVGPSPEVTSSIGLVLAQIEPLPRQLPDGAMVVISGNAQTTLAGRHPAPRSTAPP